MVGSWVGSTSSKGCTRQTPSRYRLRTQRRSELGWNPDPDSSAHKLCELVRAYLVDCSVMSDSFATLGTVARPGPLSIAFSRQEY